MNKNIDFSISPNNPELTKASRLRVLHINWGHPPEHLNAGPIFYLHHLMLAQKAQGIATVCLTSSPTGIPDAQPSLSHQAFEGVDYFHIINRCVPMFDLEHPLREIHNDRYERILLHTLQDFAPNVVHIHNLVGLSLSMLEVIKDFGATVIVSLHNYWLMCPRATLLDPELSICTGPEGMKCSMCTMEGENYNTYQRAAEFEARRYYALKVLNEKTDLLLAVSPRVKEIFCSFGVTDEKILVQSIGSKAATDIWVNLGSTRVKEDRNPEPVTFGYIGGIVPAKGVGLLLRAARKLADAGLDFRLMVSGYINDERTRLELDAILKSSLALRERYIYSGPYQQEDLVELLKQMDVAVIPPIWEDNGPQSVMESLAAGLPVLGARIGGIPFFVQDGFNGCLFEPGSVDDLFEKMKTLIEKPKMVVELKRNIVPPKTIHDHAQELEKVYLKLKPNLITTNSDAVVRPEGKLPGGFRESRLAHHYLDGLRGIEIGGSAHNSFGLQTLNIDYSADPGTIFKQEEVKICGHALAVDVVACGDTLPFKANVWDFVITSHVVEHFYDPIKALKEWHRVVKDGGYVFLIVPHKERTFDMDRERTQLSELIQRHHGSPPSIDLHTHYSCWITEDFLELCRYLGMKIIDYQDMDDKVGNGFTIVLQKAETLPALLAAADQAVSAGKLDESISILLRGREEYPQVMTIYQFLANVWALKSNFSMAEKLMAQALLIEPANAALLNQLGTILFQKGDINGSIRAYQRALQIEPNCQDALSNLQSVQQHTQQNINREHQNQRQEATKPAAIQKPLEVLVDGAGGADRSPRIAFYGARDVSTPIRLRIPAKELAALGCKTLTATEYRPDDLNQYDVFVFSRPNLNELAVEGLFKCTQAGKPVIVDLDDHFHVIPEHHPGYKWFGPGNPGSLRFLEKSAKLATVLTVSTPSLGEYYEQLGCKVRVIPNGWSRANELWLQPPYPRETINLGWAGTITHRKDVLEMRQGVTRILQEFPNTRLVIGGDQNVTHLFNKAVQKHIVFLEQVDYTHYPNILAHFDILLAPLVIDAFNQAKSDIKLLDAGIRQIPWVASPTHSYKLWKVGGIFAETPSDWYLQLKRLVQDPKLRAQLGAEGHQKALSREGALNVQHWVRLLADLGFPVPQMPGFQNGKNGKYGSDKASTTTSEAGVEQAAALLQAILTEENLIAALPRYKEKFTPMLVELLRQNAKAAREDGDQELADGLLYLAGYVTESLA